MLSKSTAEAMVSIQRWKCRRNSVAIFYCITVQHF